MRTCTKCKVEKSVTDFYKLKSGKDGLHSWCKACAIKKDAKYYIRKRAASKEWHKNNPRLALGQRLKRYGITLEKYEDMLKEQNYLCAICHKTNTNGERLAVDHDHSTGKVRGLLCRFCNTAIGSLDENISLFRRAEDYLLEHRGENTDAVHNEPSRGNCTRQLYSNNYSSY